MEKNVCIVNFNTTDLTTAAIKSLWKCTPDTKVTVFDNSDKEPFPLMDGVTVIDNTKGQVIDFDEFLERYPNRRSTNNNWGSAKHTYTIQTLFDYFPEGFVLMDSDVLVKKDVSVFFDDTYICIGEEKVFTGKDRFQPPRLLPFICWINVRKCREAGVNYFDGLRSWKLTGSWAKSDLYDTGASFLEDCKASGYLRRNLNVSEYIIHLGSGSWREKGAEQWLEEHKNLYE